MEFKTLIVYQKAKEVYELINAEILPKLADRIIKDQLKRASLSIVLNIAEGTSRISKADRKHFFVISRGSAYESFVIIDLLKIPEEVIKSIQNLLEEISTAIETHFRTLAKILDFFLCNVSFRHCQKYYYLLSEVEYENQIENNELNFH